MWLCTMFNLLLTTIFLNIFQDDIGLKYCQNSGQFLHIHVNFLYFTVTSNKSFIAKLDKCNRGPVTVRAYFLFGVVAKPQYINSLSPGLNEILDNSQANFDDWCLQHLLWNCPKMNGHRPYWWQVNTGSSNGWVPSGNKPLSEPMLTQFYVAYGVTGPQWVNRIPSNELYRKCIRVPVFTLKNLHL